MLLRTTADGHCQKLICKVVRKSLTCLPACHLLPQVVWSALDCVCLWEDYMRSELLAAVLFVAPSVAYGGVVSSVNASPSSVAAGRVIMTVTGSNPCGAVHLDYGDGTAVTHPISGLPATIAYDYARPGSYQIRAQGMGNCAGEATTAVRVVETAAPQQNPTIRFQSMDRNGDRVITRDEWRGSDRSFRVHDWNGDGVLSGDEIRPGVVRPDRGEADFDPNSDFNDWTARGFASMDHNGDARITRDEWHFNREGFLRADRNRDGVLSRAEFLGESADDDREDRFEYLDADGNGRIERDEWHGGRQAFEWLDRNNDGVLSRAEVVGESANENAETFRSLDINGNGVISFNEWHWSRNSFDQRDRNRDGVLSRSEFGTSDAVGASGRTVIVPATVRWTDSGIVVRRGDVVQIDATGTIALSTDPQDAATPEGSRTGRRAAEAPLPQQLAGGLLMRIGDSQTIAVGSSSRTLRAPADGRIYFGVNDDHLGDNRGEYRVNVQVQRGSE